MAWIYFLESQESASHSASGLEQSPIVSKTDMHKAFYCHVCNQVTLIERQSGMTLEHCEKNTCRESTLSTAGSPAKTSVLQEMESAWVESEADYFSRSCAWPKKSDPLSYSLKMSQQLELEGSTGLGKNWPALGMIVDGILYPLRKSERHTLEKDGSYLPTPTAQTYGTQMAPGPKGYRPSLETMARKNLWPTPTVDDAHNVTRKSGQFQSLTRSVQMIPTPCSRDWKDNGKSPAEKDRNSTTLATIAGGQLSPMWVEWLMGYRLNWTSLSLTARKWMKPLSKAAIRKRSQRLISLTGKSCEKCGSIESLQRHHPNYTSEDCMILCQRCHKDQHISEKTWGKGFRKEANCKICGALFIPKQNKQNKLCGNPTCLKESGKLNARKRWQNQTV